MKRKIVCQVVLIAGITSYLLFIPNVFSSTREIVFSQIEETNEFIDMKGLWDNIGIERSLPTIPISAYLSGNFIHIQNDKPDCDITIRIICLKRPLPTSSFQSATCHREHTCWN